MSVAIYSEAELNGLYQALTENGADMCDTSTALTTAAIANRLAYNRAYGAEAGNEKTTLPRDFHVPTVADAYIPVPDWTVYQWVRNLLYNCVSNGGTDFCPPKTREYLETTALAMPAKPIVQPKPTPAPEPVDFATVNDWTKAIKQALHSRTKTRFSVTHGTGTGYGWISISVAKASKTPEADAAELRALLGMEEHQWQASFSVAASRAYRQEYYARAKGETPTVYGAPYWD